MSKLRPFSAETLTVVAATITVVSIGLDVIDPMRGLLFIVGMVAGATFHIISNRTLDGGETEQQLGLSDTGDDTESNFEALADTVDDHKIWDWAETESDDSKTIGYDSARSNERRDRNDDQDDSVESASTKAVFGSNGGARGNNRNTGPSNGRR